MVAYYACTYFAVWYVTPMQQLKTSAQITKAACIWDIHVPHTHIVINWYLQSRRIGILSTLIQIFPTLLGNSVHITVPGSDKSLDEG